MTIGRKLALGVGSMLLLVGIIAAVAIRGIVLVGEMGNEILQDSIEVDAIQQLRVSC